MDDSVIPPYEPRVPQEAPDGLFVFMVFVFFVVTHLLAFFSGYVFGRYSEIISFLAR